MVGFGTRWETSPPGFIRTYRKCLTTKSEKSLPNVLSVVRTRVTAATSVAITPMVVIAVMTVATCIALAAPTVTQRGAAMSAPVAVTSPVSVNAVLNARVLRVFAVASIASIGVAPILFHQISTLIVPSGRRSGLFLRRTPAPLTP